MKTIQIEDWRTYRRDGDQFLNTALAAYRKKKTIFSAETLYNLTCMAIEKLIMAFLMSRGDLAENHTMADLDRALQRHLGSSYGLTGRLLYLNGFQEICDLEYYQVLSPGFGDIELILDTGVQTQRLLTPYLENPALQVNS
jgi:hypothetical protein